LSGDVSGSGTTSIAVTIADDSHNHVISNVDGLQTALDAKLASSSYTAADVLTKIKTVDGAGSGLDADLLDGQSSAYYARKAYWPDATTQLGLTGHSLTNLDTTALWAKPAGYQTMVRASNSNGLPSNHGQDYFGYAVTSRRDTGGGYSALLTAYDNSNMWFTYQGSSASYPTWRKLWHDGNDGSGSGLDADKLDAQQGSYYLDYNNFTNTPTIPSLSGYATESYVNTQVSNLVDSAPGTLDTLNELAAALGDDANFSTTVTNSIATKMPLAGGSFTGDVTFGTGADFGSAVASSTTDLSRHLALWGTTYGFNVTSNNINLVSAGTNTLSSTSSTLTSKVNHDFSAGIDVTGNITVTGTVDGRDIASDGSKLDGIESGATADQTAAEILTAIKTVDGSGSGLDADLLDGISSASFLRSDADDTYTGNLTVTGNINQTGALTATSKSFDIEHPTKEGMRLHHGVLEGPEHAVYIRGKSNSYIIELPDYWEGLVHEDTITVQLTPIGGQNDMWIENIEDNKVYINCEREMKQYFYFIQAERKDIERFEVEYGNSI
jgi:hypothetical protein